MNSNEHEKEQVIKIYIILTIKVLFPELNKPAPCVVSGGCTADGIAVAGATVSAYNTGGDEVSVVITDASGAYTLAPLTPGQYHVTAILRNPDGSWLQADQDVTVEGLTMVADLSLVKITLFAVLHLLELSLQPAE